MWDGKTETICLWNTETAELQRMSNRWRENTYLINVLRSSRIPPPSVIRFELQYSICQIHSAIVYMPHCIIGKLVPILEHKADLMTELCVSKAQWSYSVNIPLMLYHDRAPEDWGGEREEVGTKRKTKRSSCNPYGFWLSEMLLLTTMRLYRHTVAFCLTNTPFSFVTLLYFSAVTPVYFRMKSVLFRFSLLCFCSLFHLCSFTKCTWFSVQWFVEDFPSV